jgi:RNA polymerase sigma-70 factor (ECF subfamily)
MVASHEIGREVILSCKAGDERAFDEIVLFYQKKVFNIAYRMLGNMEEARELSQEVFLSVFESIKDLREEVKFSAWLTQIALNHCRNKWKYLKRRHYFTSESLDDPIETDDGEMAREIPDSTGNPERIYERKMVQQFIQRGLSKLKDEQREMVVLRDLQGYSYEEIGQVVHLPVGTVKSKLHRARMQLKEILERMGH